MHYAFKYLESVKGDETEQDYPYKAEVTFALQSNYSYVFVQNGRCKYEESKAVVGDKGYRRILWRDEYALQEAVANVGPISVAIDASYGSFQVCLQLKFDSNVAA